ncbi:cytochrome P450 [Gigaspora rosea]|uniref:Cytochrome P450 n=1 Tax=Gigaspora rosea TaxID=44941 RepID=A0A397W8G3_9GLOM|nr:cytochrome P450 [Gigaspora rosea]
MPSHFFQIGDEPHKKFTEWARSLGDIYSVQLGQQNLIILTSDKIVGELLQKRGAKYSTRMNGSGFEILTRGKGYAASPYNERYRKINPITSAKTKDGFYPKYFFQHTALNIISLLCFNKRTDSVDDPFYREFENLMGTRFELAKDTISASLTWLTAALANNPHVQSKAHQELDRVIGQSRMPEVSDEQNIPYIRAIIKEGQRYCGAIYLGVPHAIDEDDEYNGYHIPANSVVILNQYGIHMDEKRYENPKEFKPERFLGFTGSSAALANGNYENRDHFGFGAGRRLCTGIHMAERELLLGVSRLLWCFKIENASPLGKDGKPIPINLDKIRNGLTVWPEDYKVRFVKMLKRFYPDRVKS